MESTALKNRLQKNYKRLKAYIQNNSIEAYRIYHKDIPEYPYLIDIYGNQAVIYEQGKKLNDELVPIRESHQNDIRTALTEIFGIPFEKQIFKVRQKQKGNEQYRALSDSSDFFGIKEGPLKFWVNLERYLDTGLFLDHRPLRQHLLNNSENKKVLNLFSYTCSLSVAAAKGGAEKVTSIDMSNTYLEWGIENFKLNEIDAKKHSFFQADVLKYLATMRENGEKYDLILLDPPSFSNSKRMEEDLDIERDHPILVRDCMKLLDPNGVMHFSTNKRKFELHSIITEHFEVKETTQWTIPQDFHHTNIHSSFTLKAKNKPNL